MAQTKTAVVQTRLDAELARRLLTQMALIRRFEEKAAEMYALGKIGGFLHLYIGQEAVAVGATSTVRVDDYAVSSYREHGHCLAKGSDPRRIMAELFGRMDGLSKGKGGSMHLFDKSVNFLGGHGIVGAHLPLAAGAGLRHQVPGRRPGRAVLLRRRGGAGGRIPRVHEPGRAVEAPGDLHLREQPLRDGHRDPSRARPDRHLALRRDLRHPGEAVDGMDVLAVRDVVARAVERARRDKTPALIEARTYRFRGHSMRDPAGSVYRTKEEVEREKLRDPIALFSDRCLKEGVAHRGRRPEHREGGERPRGRGGGLRGGLAGAAAVGAVHRRVQGLTRWRS